MALVFPPRRRARTLRAKDSAQNRTPSSSRDQNRFDTAELNLIRSVNPLTPTVQNAFRTGRAERRTMAGEEISPIVVDLGKASNRRLKRLKRGRGRLTDEVAET